MLAARSADTRLDADEMGSSEAGSVCLSPEQRADYHRDGFVRIPLLAPLSDIEQVRKIYDAFFMEKRGWDTGDFFETAGDFEAAAPVLPQMNWLSRHEPSLLRSSVHRNALATARDLLGPKAELVWEFAMMKPAFVGGETPAHQDQAFFTKETDYSNAISIWIPLQDVDRENGCMEYVAGSQLGPQQPHQTIGGDPRAHGLEAILASRPDFDAVPLSAGDAVVHHSRTLHFAGPNYSARPRRAYILEFAVRSKDELLFEDYAWNLAKRTARAARQRNSTPPIQAAIERLRWIKKRVARSLALRVRPPSFDRAAAHPRELGR